jgi:predicted dienelactone hydrolase
MEKYSKIGFFMLFVFFFFQLTGQPFPIGKRDLTLNDPSRNRNIPCTFHYPGVSAGNNVAVATGQFPVIVFGHGFSMGVGAYENFADELVPLGYIICLPTTEGGLSPNHETFGLDLKFLNGEIKSKGTSDPSFFLYQKIADRTAIMGHSMGGG